MASQETAQHTPVAFLDLARTHDELKELLVADIAALIDSNAYTNGPAVAEFETAFADYCGVDHCVGVSSGIDALRFALLAAGVAGGDEVLVPANTFIATVEAVVQVGATPVLVDATDDDWNIDVDAADAAVTERTRFILPVHLYGQLADMRRIEDLSSRHGLDVIEDACQAHGAARDGIWAGTSGVASAFSFYPGKNLGAMGDAGALVTNDADVAARVRALREHGQQRKYHHEALGYTGRLDTIQALVLLRKLPLLDGWNEDRRAAARYYSEALEGVGDLRLPPLAAGSEPVWHLYVVCTERPEALAEHLRSRGIATGRHYPQPVHLSGACRDLGYPEGAFPVTERLARECLSLPIFPGITEGELDAVVEAVADFFDG